LVKATVIGLGQLGKITRPQVTGLSHGIIIAMLAALCLAMFRLFEKKRGLTAPILPANSPPSTRYGDGLPVVGRFSAGRGLYPYGCVKA
jgi:hypothetical protein